MKNQADRGRATLSLALLFGALAFGAPLSGQTVDVRWAPFLGCWEPAGEWAEAELVCVRPGVGSAEIEIVTLAGSEVIARELIRADGRRRDISRESCEGWEEAVFSQDHRRVYMRSSLACDGGVAHETSAIFSLTSPVEWLDVRTAGTPGRHAAWVQRFVPADPALAEAAGFGELMAEGGWPARMSRLNASEKMTVDDVIEASAYLPVQGVQALVAERGDSFQLSAATLIRMADAGVADDVIDVTVAVSFPDQFRVGPAGTEVAASALDRGSMQRRWAPGAGPMWYDPFYAPWRFRYGYLGYGYGVYSPYGYSPFGFGWGYGGAWGYTPTVVVVDRVRRNEGGRVIEGRGYSRGSSGSSNSGGSSGTSAGPSRSSGGSPSAGGTNSGASSTGRTARPRGG